MKDDFDNRMGLPDDELPGGSGMSDMGDSSERAENDMDMPGNEPSGRRSGGARTRKTTGGHKASPSRKAAGGRKSSSARKSAGGGGARKASKSGAKKKGGGRKKGARKAARKSGGTSKRGGAKKAGRRRSR
jgi:hypothetical protein